MLLHVWPKLIDPTVSEFSNLLCEGEAPEVERGEKAAKDLDYSGGLVTVSRDFRDTRTSGASTLPQRTRWTVLALLPPYKESRTLSGWPNNERGIQG